MPAGYSGALGGTAIGAGNIELAAKLRFLRQDTFGFDVSVFPASGSSTIGDNDVFLPLPIWLQNDFGKLCSAFGGGGCTFNEASTADFCRAGAVLTNPASCFIRPRTGKARPHPPASATDGATTCQTILTCLALSGAG